MERTTVPVDGSDGEATVELGLRALRDGTEEGAEDAGSAPGEVGL